MKLSKMITSNLFDLRKGTDLTLSYSTIRHSFEALTESEAHPAARTLNSKAEI